MTAVRFGNNLWRLGDVGGAIQRPLSPARRAAYVAGRFGHTVRNDSREPLRVILEPWGEEFTIFPGAELYFAVSGNPEPVALETSWSGEHLSLFGPEGSVVHAYHHRVEVPSGYKAHPVAK